MKTNPNNQLSSGIALVTVLVITAVTLALGYAALTISLSVLQGSKSAEHSVQARMNAESGLDAVLVYLDDRLQENDELNVISLIPRVVSMNSLAMSFGENYNFIRPPTVSPLGDTHIEIGGYGPDNAVYITSADIFYNLGSGTDTDPDATPNNPSTIYDVLYRGVTSCSILDVNGSGQILGGAYVYSSDDVILSSGDGRIEGDIRTTGSVDVSGSAKVYGDIWSSESVTLTGGQTEVNGNIASGGDLSIASANINGYLVIDGDIKITAGDAKVSGHVYASGQISVNNGAKIIGETIYAKKGISINGSSRAEGDIYTPGNVNLSGGGDKVVGNVVGLGSTSISGNGTKITENIFINHHVTLGEGIKLDGNLYVDGDIEIQSWGPVIKGDVFSTGSLELIHRVTIEGSAYLDGSASLAANEVKIVGDLHTSQPLPESQWNRVGGNRIITTAAGSLMISHLKQLYLQRIAELEKEFQEINTQRAEQELQATICNLPGGLSVANDIASLQAFASPTSGDILTGSTSTNWILTPNRITLTRTDGTNIDKTPPIRSGSFGGKNIVFMHVTNFDADDKNHISVEGGDVVLLVDKEINIKSPNYISIAPDSSLTILTPSQVDIGTSAGTAGWNILNEKDYPSLTFFTSYGSKASENGNAFELHGGHKVFPALVYAPDAPVRIHSSELIGAVVGRKVTVTGGGAKLRYTSELLDFIGQDPDLGSGDRGLIIVNRR